MKNEIIKLSGNAYCQSNIDNYHAIGALSEKETDCWKATPYYQWWLYDVEKVCYLNKIFVVFGHQGQYYHYHIEYSIDRINWNFLVEKSDSEIETECGNEYAINDYGRFIRITVSYCSNSDEVEIDKVDIFGSYPDTVLTTFNNITSNKVKVINADSIFGFSKVDTNEIEPGWFDVALKANNSGDYLCFKNVDFGMGKYDQLRLLFGLPIKDKTSFVNIECHLDSPKGELVGIIHLCYQYSYWTEIAAELVYSNGKHINGIHSLYLTIGNIDKPQEALILWVSLNQHPCLSKNVIDYGSEIINKNGEYKIFFGNMHCHTSFSDGSSTPEFAYTYARDIAKLDFLGITEHSNCLDEAFDCSKSRKFRDIKETAERLTENEKFVALYGSETTFYNQFGHMNIYCADFYINSSELKYNDNLKYYEKLKDYPFIISQWNHPWSCGNRHFDMFKPYDSDLDKITYTIELNDIEMDEKDVLKYYISALEMGWHIAPVGNQDNHKKDWGTENGIRTGVITTSLTAGNIYDAMKNLRVYFSGAPGIRVLFSINNHIQGSILHNCSNLIMNLKGTLDGDEKFSRLDVYGSSGKMILQKDLSGNAIEENIHLPTGNKYIFLKVVREDNKYVITAPIWVEQGEK